MCWEHTYRTEGEHSWQNENPIDIFIVYHFELHTMATSGWATENRLGKSYFMLRFIVKMKKKLCEKPLKNVSDSYTLNFVYA